MGGYLSGRFEASVAAVVKEADERTAICAFAIRVPALEGKLSVRMAVVAFISLVKLRTSSLLAASGVHFGCICWRCDELNIAADPDYFCQRSEGGLEP